MEQQEAAHCESEQLPSRVHCKKCQMCPRDQVCPAGYYGSTRSSKGSRSAIFLSDHLALFFKREDLRECA
jgi:hypothetical protein